MGDALAPREGDASGSSALERVRAGGKTALAASLATLERAPDAEETLALLDAAYAAPRAHVIGLTGPPGVGKSTLIGALIAAWRARGSTVAVIAVDPSSRASGGALLGDRTRLRTDPDDPGIFVRSMAARDRLGGLAALTVSAMVLMRALYDIVLIETVGVGQSEDDVVGVADTVVLCLQPGAGDALQFMKAGIVEIPHIIAVTKSDLGEIAERTRGEAAATLGLTATEAPGWRVPVLGVSVVRHEGIAALLDAIAAHHAALGRDGLAAQRQGQAETWLADAIRDRFGREGLRRLGAPALGDGVTPFRALGGMLRLLAEKFVAS
jgi:LAO/AO transport system kinase